MNLCKLLVHFYQNKIEFNMINYNNVNEHGMVSEHCYSQDLHYN